MKTIREQVASIIKRETTNYDNAYYDCADRIFALLKKVGCCCEYLGQCDTDPQKPDYCPKGKI